MIEHSPYKDASDQEITERIEELKRKLGVEDIQKVPALHPQILPPADDPKVQ